ncbi:MAG: hypothetical protein AB7P60_21540 [Hyphomicrobiaceae bacterium]
MTLSIAVLAAEAGAAGACSSSGWPEAAMCIGFLGLVAFIVWRIVRL